MVAADMVEADKAAAVSAATNKTFTSEGAAKVEAVEGTAVKKSIMVLAGPGPTPVTAVGSKRAATPSDSTPSQKRVCGPWKQRYIVLFRSLFFFPLLLEQC
jgi:hypothetical protein